MDKRIYLSPPDITGREIEHVMEAFNSNWIAPLGPLVDKFEQAVSGKIGIKSALALSSGTSAIHLALKYIGVNPGDTVFCSSLTFSGSCNPVCYERGELVFIDSERESWNMCPLALEKALVDAKRKNKLPKAVIVVNLYGQSADMDRILPLCEAYGVPVIEDAAESLGAYYKGRSSGTFGMFGTFSFNGNKIVTTSGGGMLVSDNEEAIEKCRFWSTQAREKAIHYEHKEIGYNYRLSNVLAGIGLGQYEQIDQKIEKKKSIYDRYVKAFSDIEEISMNPIPDWSEPNYWLSVLLLCQDSHVKPSEVLNKLQSYNIESRPVWKPMHLQPVFADSEFVTCQLNGGSVSEDLFQKGLCIPSGTSLSREDQDKVIEVIRSLFKKP
ncbi:MAG: aminotransferase class I/II-fold pyridoxal phosphate-dependent enzyme [Clostridia bacterium]|nr:aminotransferase class I/II-fold pyridoxal phosphate-dependent enzyme [Clostridia bacterium]